MNDFTPDLLINRLNEKFPSIINEAIKGYKSFYDKEQEFISKINKDIIISDLLNNELTKKQLNYLIAYANILKYGKSYFMWQIVYNLIQMEMLTDYVNYIGPLLQTKETKSNVTIEELPSEGQKGGGPFDTFIKLIVTIIFISITTTTSTAQNIASFTDVSVTYDINIEQGKIPKAVGYQDTLDPTIEEELREFTKQYKQNLQFPSDKLLKQDISQLSVEPLMDSITTNNLFSSLFMGKQYLREKVTETLKSQTKKINNLARETNLALEQVCKSFVETTDPSLPIDLVSLFNSELARNLNKLQESREKIEQQRRSELTEQKLLELQIREAEPTLMVSLNEKFKGTIGSISNIFSWSSSSNEIQSTTEDNAKLSSSELVDLYAKVEQDVETEINSLSEQLDINVFQEVASSVESKLIRDATEALRSTNLRIYLSAICHIKTPTYVFNQTENIIYLKDPVSSRTHLKVLAENVVSYYKTVTEDGIHSIKDGQVVVDVPGEERQINMKSLLEKSQYIIEILTNYDIGLTRTLLDVPLDADVNVLDFFENIGKMWIDLKTKSIQALVQFPITEREKNREIDRKKEESRRLLESERVQNQLETEERLQTLAQNQESNSLTKQEWESFNKWFSINTGGVLGVGTGVLNNIVNSTTDVGNNAVNNLKMLSDNGMSGIISVVWGIAYSGMLITLPAILVVALYSGCITAVFSRTARRLNEDNNVVRIQGKTEEVIAPYQSTRLTVMPDENYHNFLKQQEEGEVYNPLKIYEPPEKRGGNYNKYRYRKTRKNKKHRTKKLKYGKKRQTKHRKKRITKKH